ncbi:39S ribosomal protein L38, mitochondrial-like [Penaeus chinensis]|uniref:39S ribosomal protein L38, mitochondrial-like n=1 Tax=Penaeus chinensis TaxID=139456 RepID=UPI001FB84481|nr:39S ribosomal protein L38, mitochondrial-like [Penaeus chinensis]
MAAMSRGLATALLATALCCLAQGQHGIAESRSLRVQGAPDTHGFHGVQRFRQLLKIHENRHNLPGGVILARPPQAPTPHPAAHEFFTTPALSFPVNLSSLTRPPAADTPLPPREHHQQEAQGSLGLSPALESPTTSPHGVPQPAQSPPGSQAPLHSLSHFESTRVAHPAPEAPRAPEIPAHLPLDLVSRLKEYPNLEESLNQAPLPASMHTFFEPTIQVRAEEVSDEEWGQYLESEWESHGIVPSFLPRPPPYLINVNYGDHLCVHLGSLITPAQARHQPKALQFPGESGRYYALLLLDLDHPAKPYVNWMLVNIPHKQPQKGTEVVQYDPPRPAQGSGSHRVVFLLYLQQAAIPPDDPALPKARSCQKSGRDVVDLDAMSRDLGLKGPVAGNYFLAEWDVTVEHSCTPPRQ